MKWLATILTIATLGVSACSGPKIMDAACNVWQPLSYALAKDTPETVKSIQGNNAAQKSYCG